MTPDEWGALQEGIIFEINGNIPGDIQISIDLEDIRKQFPNEGNGFIVKLTNCSSIEYKRQDQATIKDIAIIANEELEILCLAFVDPVELACQSYSGKQGDLVISYETATLFLDSGEIIPDEQLHVAYAKSCDD